MASSQKTMRLPVTFGALPRTPTTRSEEHTSELQSLPTRRSSDLGWSQLKFQLTPKLELNGVFAEDNAFASDVRGFATDANNFGAILGRNRGGLGNLVYLPRSDLLLSAEFRRLHPFPVYDSSSVTNQINLSMGILF